MTGRLIDIALALLVAGLSCGVWWLIVKGRV